MSDVFLCVVRGIINVNKFEVRLLPSSHLNVRARYQLSYPDRIQFCYVNSEFIQLHDCCFVCVCVHVLCAEGRGGTHGRPQEFFQGGANLWGAPQKSVKGGPHIFFRQALKYAYRGWGGGSFETHRVIF